MPNKYLVEVGDITFKNFESIDEDIQFVKQHKYLSGDWFFCPDIQLVDSEGGVRTLPYKNRIFSLPKTHYLEHKNAEDIEHLDFIVWCISFFLGIRLSTYEAGFLDSTPIRTGIMNDFVLIGCSLEDVIYTAEGFWQINKNNPRKTKRITGIIHCLFLSYNTQSLCFEQFMYLYSALDACYASISKLTGTKAKTHAQRIENICLLYGIPLPEWAASKNTSTTEVSYVRNDTFHEALFFNEPLGFSIYGGNTTHNSTNVILEMQNLVCRILVAILTDSRKGNAYIMSEVNTRSTHGLNLKL